MFSDEKVTRDLPILREKFESLRQLAAVILPRGFTHDENDHYAFMLVSFLAKQKEHASSLVSLINNNHWRDASLIVRSMIEGLVLLKWAARDLEVRPVKWRAFVYVCDWRLMKALLNETDRLDDETVRKIHQGLDAVGEQFLTDKAKRRRDNGESMPDDPFVRTWHSPLTRSQIFKEVEAEDLLRKLYGPFSAWHHWDPDGIGGALHRRVNKISYTRGSERDAATALASAFQCLFEVTQAADGYLQLGHSHDLDALREIYVKSIREKNPRHQ